jgi:thermitase
VRFKPGLALARKAEILAQNNARGMRRVAALEVEVLGLPPGLAVERAVEIFSRLPEVEYAEPNYLLTIAETGESWEANQWAPQVVQAPEAWAEIPNPAPVVLAIVDSGVDYRHKQLAPNMYTNPAEWDGTAGVDDDGNGYIDDIYGRDFINNDGDPLDDHSHGTHVAGLAAATRGTAADSMAGICPFCQIMAVKVLGSDGTGGLDVVANGITYAVNEGAKVINLSLGGSLGTSTLQSAVDYAWNNGVLVVAAAGNNGSDQRFYPAAYPNAIAVAATNSQDYRSCFSNYGNFSDPFVDVSAPGESNYSTIPLDANGNHPYASFSGTSMASPHVTGLAGLLFAQDPGRTNTAVRDLIEGTTEDLGPAGADPFFGTGRINAYRAVTNSQSATTPADGLFTTSATGTGYPHARKLVREAGGKLHLVWHTQEVGNFRVRHATSSDNGANWTVEADVYSGPLETYQPAVALDGSYLYVAYPQRLNSSAKYQVFFTRKPLSGGAWSAPVPLLGGTYDAVRPDLFLDPSNGRLHLVASSLENTEDVYYSASSDQGANWTAAQSIIPSPNSTTDYLTRYAGVYANGDQVTIVARTVTTGFLGAFYTHTVRSADGGATWSSQSQISSSYTFYGEYGLALAGVSDRLYMGYEVGSDGSGGLYFRRNDAGTWSNFQLLESDGHWPTITQSTGGQAWMLWENAGSLLMRHFDGSTWESAQTLLAATSFNKGFFPNLKLGTGGDRVEWVYTHCSGAPFRLVYGSLDLGPIPPPPTPPAAPSGLAATSLSTSEIGLSWTDNAGDETGFKIERSLDGLGNWTEVAQTGANATSYTDGGLSAATTYYYRVRANNGNGDSGYSNVANATTQTPPPPASPSNLAATALSTSEIGLTWTDNSSDETGFRIERSPGGANSWTEIFTTGANATTYTDGGLAADTTYDYRVSAFNAYGSSAPSASSSGTTFAPLAVQEFYATGETTVAGTRSGDYTRTFADDGADETLSEVESGGKPANRYTYLDHRWTFSLEPGGTTTFYANAWRSAPADGDAFRFEYSLDNASFTPMFTVTGETDGSAYSTFTLPGPISGTVWVRAVDTDRTPGARWVDTLFVDHLFIRVETASGDPPPPPSGLTATAVSSSQIDLAWTDTSGELGYMVERSTDGTSWQAVADLPADSTSHADTGLQAGTIYYYRLKAYNTSGESAYSEAASATTEPATQLELHVGDLDGSAAPGRSGRWDASVTITVHDQDHAPVPGASVTGTWSAGASGTGTCITNSAGTCSVSKTGIKSNVASVQFSVTGISLEGAVYNSVSNHDPDGDSNGSVIVVNRP